MSQERIPVKIFKRSATVDRMVIPGKKALWTTSIKLHGHFKPHTSPCARWWQFSPESAIIKGKTGKEHFGKTVIMQLP
jgi:hypothetical protein